MSNVRSINVNIEEETAMVQVGATIGELYYKIWEKNKVHAFPAGVCPTVGIRGHIKDRFWAIQGGGGASFGVILAYKLQPVQLDIQKPDCKEMSWIEFELFWSSNVNNPVEILLERNFLPKFSKRKSSYLQTPIPRDGIKSL
ncbi:hypothetical protein L1987_71285 [Smallanthus sonchifolius]|uniref:Uncharacterized protein n=1 Tax=Smallanthus sonchifolius TaxID=185202 RepID=A0ACB9AWC1_9ASTR|nr:hypothetical protein L1987_71285 [Smallanthus sonchifolius]